MRRAVRALAVLGCGLSAVYAHAAASLPYTPSWIARHQLERLADEAGLAITLTHWPVPGAALRSALQALPPDLPPDLSDARDAVLADLDRAERPTLTVRAKTRSEALVGFDDDYVPGSSVALRSGAIDTGGIGADWLALGVGARAEQPAGSLREGSAAAFGTPPAVSARLDDTALVLQAAGVNLQAFAHRDWWGPAWQNSLILGNNTPAWVGLGLQRAQLVPSESKWLSWLGPWNAEYFVAKAQDPLVVANQSQGFLFVGARLTVKPHPLVELGLTRTWQTGGRGLPQGWGAFWRAMLARDTNPPDASGQSQDPGNEMAGVDLRVSCGQLARCAFYTQDIGEDVARFVPTKILALFGAETWSADGRHRWFIEHASSSCDGLPWEHALPGCAYLNHQYLQGYTNGTRWAGASIGSDSSVTTLGWYAVAQELRVRLHVGRIGVSLGAYAPGDDAPHGRFQAISAEQAVHVAGATLTGVMNWSHLSDGVDIGPNRRSDLQLGVTASWPLR